MQINGYEFTIGADPEFFIAKGGKPVSGWGTIPGTKKAPKKVGYGAVQVDGMALEINIDPAKGEAGFLRNLESVLRTVMEMVPEYEMFDKPVAHFGKELIMAQPKEARELGCEPDYNAYTKAVNPRPDVDTPFRTAAGHVHIGWTDGVDPMDKGHFDACCALTKALDVTLGVPSLIWDQDEDRRKLYGKAGCFRPKPYGMEYRVLSNAWINPAFPFLRKAVFNNTMKGIKSLFDNENFGDTMIAGESAQSIINNSNKQAVVYACKYMPELFDAPKKFREAV